MSGWKPLPPTYFWLTVLFMIVLNFLLPILRLIPMPYNFSGAILMLLGLLMNIWASNYFNRVKTTVKPFQESNHLITDGLFKISRNPMYLGMVLALLGLFLILGSISSFLPIPIYIWQMQKKFIEAEEKDLEKKFGESYRTYAQRVRRWL